MLLAGLLLSAQVLADVVWVALSGKEPIYLEVANAVRAGLPDDDVRVGGWNEFNFKLGAPDLLVTIGGEALRQLQPVADRTPIVTALVPRANLDALRDGHPGRLTSVYYEPPIARQAHLLRAAFPDKTRVGIVLGPATERYRAELGQALRRIGMEAVFEVIADKSELTGAVQNVLARSDVLLALPDPDVVNSQSAKFILLSSYRHGVPVAGFSASFVKAGAAVAIVSSPEQNGQEVAKMVREALASKRLPSPRPPADYQVLVNASVSRSLNLDLDEAAIGSRLRGEKGMR